MADDQSAFIDMVTVQFDAHVFAYQEKQKSRIEKKYSLTMQKSAQALRTAVKTLDFDGLLRLENTLAQIDFDRYSDNEAVRRNVLTGIRDLEAGESNYQVLRSDPETYFKWKYVKREMAGLVPIDSMRKALRGQVNRVNAYATSPMINEAEREFQKARIAMLHRAEELYDSIQRRQREKIPPGVLDEFPEE